MKKNKEMKNIEFSFNRLKLILLFLVIFLWPGGFASAACDVYVSTTGIDGTSCGTQSSPCRHIEYAVEQRALSGQTVCVNDGTYAENTISFPLGVSLTAVNQIYPNPKVKISAASEVTSLLNLVSSTPVKDGNHEISYIEINGNPFKPQFGIEVKDRNNIHIHHCYLHDHIDLYEYTRAIRVVSSECAAYEGNWKELAPYDGRDLNAWHAKWVFEPVENIEIDHCTIIDWGRTPTTGGAGTGGIQPVGWKGGSIHDCYFEATDPGYYIKFIQATGGYIEDVDIYDNIIRGHNRGSTGAVWSVEIWGHINTRLFNNDVNLPFSWTYGYGSEVFNNTVIAESEKSVGIEGIGQSNYKAYNNFISVGSEGGLNCGLEANGAMDHILGNVEIFNNVIENVWYKPIAIIAVSEYGYDKEVHNIKIYNNVANNAYHYGWYFRHKSLDGGTMLVDNIEFKNNIITNAVEAGGRYYYEGNGVIQDYIIDHNMYYNCGINGFDGLTETNKLVANPLFISINDGDYHLQSTSPAIDAGVDVGLPYSGSAPDIGAYEYGEVSCLENWICEDWSDWSDCLDNQQFRTRTCNDSNECGTEDDKPKLIETQDCEIPIIYGISDFIQLVSDWLKSETNLTSDLNNDNIVNTRDLGIMMSRWE